MCKWKFKDGRIGVGIDVGWSPNRPSCSLAFSGVLEMPEDGHFKHYAVQNTGQFISTANLRLCELVNFLTGFVADIGDRVRDLVVLLDGPIGPDGPPHENRLVDSACRCNGFYGRTQPSDVKAPDGQHLVEATYAVVNTLTETGFAVPWFGGDLPAKNLVYAETNPTVGMALMLPQQPLPSLPSRNRPIRSEERVFRAKSDWYWWIGVRQLIAGLLGAPDAATEANHDRVAGLLCLEMARELATQGQNTVAIGNDRGVYVVSHQIHATWQDDINRIMLANGGTPDFVKNFAAQLPAENAPVPVLNGPVNDADDVDDGVLVLLLNDNGGVCESWNDWLVGLNSPVHVTTNDELQTPVALTGAEGAGQWKCHPTTLFLARARGFVGPHLSIRSPVAIHVQLVQ